MTAQSIRTLSIFSLCKFQSVIPNLIAHWMDGGKLLLSYSHAADAFVRFFAPSPRTSIVLCTPLHALCSLAVAVCYSFFSSPAFLLSPHSLSINEKRGKARLAARFQYLGFCPIRFLSFFRTFMRVLAIKWNWRSPGRLPKWWSLTSRRVNIGWNSQKFGVHFQILHRFCWLIREWFYIGLVFHVVGRSEFSA